MGIETVCKKWILKTFPNCVSFDSPNDVNIVSIDMMQYLKGSLPDGIDTTIELLKYLVHMITVHFDINKECKIVIANFDLKSPAVKAIVTHPTRYDKRCRKCKSTPDFHADCEKKCQDKKAPLEYDGKTRWIHADLNHELPVKGDEWNLFASDSRNLRAELYPLLMNELINTIPKYPNQMILVNGLPVRTRLILPHEFEWECGYTPTGTDNRVRVIKWLPEELPISLHDEKLFENVFMIKWVPPTPVKSNGWILITECPEMKNKIHEADNAVYFFSNFFPQDNYMVVINDGDAIPIGLLRVAEDFKGGIYPTHTTYLRLPFKDVGEMRRLFGNDSDNIPKYQYINLSQLFSEISGYKPFLERGVQNPVATVVFLIILAGTDFFKRYCPGIGYKTSWKEDDPVKMEKQTCGIWDTFIENLEMYSHMVQLYNLEGERDPTVRRKIIIDRYLFRLFTYKCYFNKYMKNKEHNSLNDLQVRCSKLKREEWHLPDVHQIDVWCQNINWNLHYWVNACRDIYIDPFEKVNGMSYWGFDDDKMAIATCVYPKQKGVDEVYKRHFYKRKKQPTTKLANVSETKKRKIVKRTVIKR